MLNKENEYHCGRADDIVAYIYDEIGPSKRENFETHLSGCGSCTDEFAAVADARFSVFEWHKEEFLHLPTPEFSIPYAAETRSGAGLLASFRGMVSGMGWPATIAAAVMVCVGLTFAVMIVINGGQQQIAHTVVERETPSDRAESTLAAAIPEQPEIDEADELPEPEPTFAATITKRSTRGTAKNSRPLNKPSPKPRTRAVPLPTYSTAPVLSSYEDNEDRSLRLSDLMDEVGG